MSIEERIFGYLADGTAIRLFTLTNSNGMQAEIMTYGGTLVRLTAPDRDGRYQDVVLGYDSLDEYVQGDKFFGALIGRYANRIAGGSYQRNGHTYSLTQNEKNSTTLHGGCGFDQRVWSLEQLQTGNHPSLTLAYQSADGEEGFPGNLLVRVIYQLQEDNTLSIQYHAVADQETPINLTNHSYFNLTGDFSQTVLAHRLQINALFFTPVDTQGIPTGEILSVKNTPMDFTEEKTIEKDLFSENPGLKAAKGYDHNYVLEGADGVRPVAQVYEPVSGRMLMVCTDKPGMQLYTSNYLDGSEQGKNGVALGQYSGVCLETQYFPDSVHFSHFPTPFYEAGEEYSFTTSYHFTVK